MFNKENSILPLVIAVLLGLILLVLVFKAGMYVGVSKSHYAPHKAGNIHRNFDGYKKGEEYKKLMIEKMKSLEEFEAKAESMGMTVEEYKESLIEEKK